MFLLRTVTSRLLSGKVKQSIFRPFQTSQHAEEIPHEERFVQKAEVERFMIDCMEKMKTPKDKAIMIAANLSEADYRGHFSHGLNRLTMYVNDIGKDCCNPRADPVVLKEGPCTAWVDGNNGLGVVVGTFSMQLAIKKAKEVGVGWVVAKNSNHFGICQWYSEMAIAEGLVGIASTNTSPLVAPTRAKNVVFGTNPFCVGAPVAGSKDSFLIDMSTSAVAVGKIEMQMRKNEQLPSLGWALGADGKPTTDAFEAFYKGAGVMPLGGPEINSGYKGYGLAMFVELICGLMSGSKYAHQIRSWVKLEGKADLSHCFVAVNPECFAPGLGDRLQDLMHHLRNLEPLNSDEPVLVPGDPERLSIEKVEKVGAIFYTEDHIRTYRELAEKLNVRPMQHFKAQ